MDDNHWHLDKRINLSHLVATGSVIAGLLIWGSTIESRLAVLENQQIANQNLQIEIKQELVRLNQKIDQFLIKAYRDK